MFANYKTILKRDIRLKRGSRLTKERITNLYQEYCNAFDFDKFVEGAGENEQVENCVEAMKIVENER